MTVPADAILIHDMLAASVRHSVESYTRANHGPSGVAAHAEAALRALGHRLRTPARTPAPIALYGTTSSGKSSFVNALVGGQLVPTVNREMSAGLLTVRHGLSGIRLWVHSDDSVLWNSSHYVCRDFREANTRLKSLLYLFREFHTESADLKGPSVEAEVDFSFAANMLGIADPTSMVIYDLPGLRTVRDRTHDAVLERYQATSAPIVFVNYAQLYAREELHALISGLKARNRWVQQGISPVVVLNRADLFTSANSSLEESRTDVSNQLGQLLERPIEVGLLSTHLLQGGVRLARCFGGLGWLWDEAGGGLLEAARWCQEHCQQGLRVLGQADRETRRRLEDLWESIEFEDTISPVDARWLAQYCFEAGGGRWLIQELRTLLDATIQEQVSLSTWIRGQAHMGYETASGEVQRQRVQVVVAILEGIMRADEQIHEDEEIIVDSLVMEYCCRFAPAMTPVHGTQTMAPLDRDTVIRRLRSLRFPHRQVKWLIRAMNAVMAVDGTLDDRERQQIDFFTLALER